MAPHFSFCVEVLHACVKKEGEGMEESIKRVDALALRQGYLPENEDHYQDIVHGKYCRASMLYSRSEDALVPRVIRPPLARKSSSPPLSNSVSIRVGDEVRCYYRAMPCTVPSVPLPRRYQLNWREQIWWRAQLMKEGWHAPYLLIVAHATGLAAYGGQLIKDCSMASASAVAEETSSLWRLPHPLKHLQWTPGIYMFEFHLNVRVLQRFSLPPTNQPHHHTSIYSASICTDSILLTLSYETLTNLVASRRANHPQLLVLSLIVNVKKSKKVEPSLESLRMLILEHQNGLLENNDGENEDEEEEEEEEQQHKQSKVNPPFFQQHQNTLERLSGKKLSS